MNKAPSRIIKQLEVAPPTIFSDAELLSLRRSEYAFVPVKPLRCIVIKQKSIRGHFQEELSGSWTFHVAATLSYEGRDVFQLHGTAETLPQAVGAVEASLKGAGFDPELPPVPNETPEVPLSLEVVPASDLLK